MAEALRLLDTGGQSALTFKALGAALEITPMAVAHHVGSRQNMMELLVKMVFEGVEAQPEAATPALRIRELAHRYCARVIRHPALVTSILENPGLFGGSVQALTEKLKLEILAAGGDGAEADAVLDLIVDYTHGFAFAAAADPDRSLSLDDYAVRIDWILDRMAKI
ncbi:hypothetical protein [Leisingera thetidis]|uniref:hypothetical protein n=1 Tax=Leisingera thetidis TaxID=2930199 RepID=UPI0021F797E8|nr:hypothetical protein [Leisingera thetidis]